MSWHNPNTSPIFFNLIFRKVTVQPKFAISLRHSPIVCRLGALRLIERIPCDNRFSIPKKQKHSRSLSKGHLFFCPPSVLSRLKFQGTCSNQRKKSMHWHVPVAPHRLPGLFTSESTNFFAFFLVLLMVQKSGKLTSWYGKFFHYLQGFIHPWRFFKIVNNMISY